LTGYVYCHAHSVEKKKLVWHSKRGGLYYRYAAFGLLFAILGYFIYLVVFYLRPEFLIFAARYLSDPINNALPGSWPTIHAIIGITASSLLVSYIAGKLASWRAQKNHSKAIYQEIDDSEDSFSRVLLVAMENRLTVIVNLDGNKVYVGYPVEFYSPYLEHSWLQILPVMSGYRREATKELVLTTDYAENVHKHIRDRIEAFRNTPLSPRLDDFALTISIDRIHSFGIFDVPFYVSEVLGEKKVNN
jgi:hypothetical protein